MIKPFKFWAQHVLPLVYDDSLSYYEVLEKVANKLNEVIDNENQITIDMNTFREEWVRYQENIDKEVSDIRTFVVEYFNNLNLTEEVRNILQEYVNNGTLDDLIAPHIPTAVSQWLSENVNPVGSAVVVDDTFTISGAAADSKTVGDKAFWNRQARGATESDVWGNTYNNIFDLPINSITSFHGSGGAEAGLPDECLSEWHTVIKFSSQASNISKGFTLYIVALYNNSIYLTYTNNESTVETVQWTKLYKNFEAINVNEQILDDAWASTNSILNVPTNTVSQVAFNVDNPLNIGFPANGPATLLKYAPFSSQSNNYCVYIFNKFISGAYNEMYYSYSAEAATPSQFVWNKVTNTDNSFMPDETLIDNNYALSHTIFDIPYNTITRVSSNISDFKSFGLPETGWGTLLKFRPYLNHNINTGFTLYVFTRFNGNTPDMYFTYVANNANVSQIYWSKIGRNYDKNIRRLGYTPIKIAFIGDSTIEGFGSSDYNGGPSATYNHQINNTIKTWYRNTGSSCWVNKMIDYLTSNYNDVACVNNGIGGLTVLQLQTTLDTLIVMDDNTECDVCVIGIGINSRSANKLNAIETPLRDIIRRLKIKGIQPIVLTSTPIVNQNTGSNNQAINAAIKTACAIERVECYDIYSELAYYIWKNNVDMTPKADQTVFMHDNLHPADIGYNIIYNVAKNIIQV